MSGRLASRAPNKDPAGGSTAASPALPPARAEPAAEGKGATPFDHAINQRLFETSLDLIVVVDRRGTIIRISPCAQGLLGYDPRELIGKSAATLLYAEDLDYTRNEMRMARRGQMTRSFDCRYVHKDGHLLTLAWKGIWSEREQQYFFIGRDMTERLKLEEQLHQAQKMESIGQLTGGVAHDFNNILTIIIGMNEILAGAVAGSPNLTELTTSIDQAAERGVQLAQRMLAFARKQPLHARVLDLNEIVTRAAAVLRPTLGEHIKVETQLHADLWQALADPSRLEDAILNLAVNARDAMPKGGRLLIETGNVYLDEDYAADHVEVTPGDYAAVMVSDTGTGMPPDVIARAFEPFFTTKEVGHGTGLGLSMVYGFVKQSRGHIRIYSEVGHGTSINLYLPKAAGTAAEASPQARHEQHTAGQETILVVEDDADVRKVAVTALESVGYRVLQAPDGKVALDVLEDAGRIDLLFTDLVMPNGVGGQDLARLARERRPDLKVLFTSGYSERFIKGLDNASQEIPLLAKPYRRQAVLATIRRVLDGRT
jgi:PAS domain S-box-containing protein